MRSVAKEIAIIVLFGILFIGVSKSLQYVLVDDTKSYSKMMIRQLYETPENADVVFVGSSHVYRSFVPEIIDKELDCYSFMAGTGMQHIDGSYALIKELNKFNEIETVYLELYYPLINDTNFNERSDLTDTYIISDYLHPSFNKYSYILKSGDKDTWINGLIPARREWNKIFDVNYMRYVYATKKSGIERTYEVDQSEYYVDRGYCTCTDVVPEDRGFNGRGFGDIVIPDLQEENDWYDTLNSIISFCGKNNIELNFVVAPEPEWTVVAKRNYQEYHDFVKKIATEKDIKLYDFNLIKSDFFDADDRSLFYDEDHLNRDGSQKFSDIFCKVVKDKVFENYFYDTLEEKLMEENPKVYGIAGPKKDHECYIISNRAEGMKYSIRFFDEDDNMSIIQEFSENIYFKLPADHGSLEIEWYLSDDEDNITRNLYAF